MIRKKALFVTLSEAKSLGVCVTRDSSSPSAPQNDMAPLLKGATGD